MKRFVLTIILAVCANGVFGQTIDLPSNETNQKPSKPLKTFIFASPGTKKIAGAAVKPTPPAVVAAANPTAAPPLADATTAANRNSESAESSANQREQSARNSNENQSGAAAREFFVADNSAVVAAPKAETAASESAARDALEIYRVGTGDVLDIRLRNAGKQFSTLYTVLPDGTLDYPLAGAPLLIERLTLDEIKDLLAARVTLYEKPEFSIAIRDYASHRVAVSGLIEKPGVQILRREAVPLYAVLAAAGQSPAAAKAIVRRGAANVQEIDLKQASSEFLIVSGDAIEVAGANVAAAAPQFYYLVGAIKTPGEKEFRSGLTLTQAVFAAGGTIGKTASKVVILRHDSANLLTTLRFGLKEIRSGKIADPLLQPGDRIEIND